MEMTPLFGIEKIREVYPRSESTILNLHRTAGFPMSKNCGRWETTREAIYEWLESRAKNGHEGPQKEPKKKYVKPKKW